MLTSKENDQNIESSESDEDVNVSISDTLSTKNITASTSELAPICKPKNTKKGPFDFEQLRMVQEINNEHTGAIWCIKFRFKI